MGDWFGEEVILGREQVKLATEEVRALTDVELIVFAGNELHYLLADTKIASRVGHLMLVRHLVWGGEVFATRMCIWTS
jgi:hypothetical protein